jgi:ABC-type phosphate transport system substrate-binding protein
MHRLRIFCFALVLFAAPLGLARDLAIIVDKSNGSSMVTSDELEKLFKASLQKWPDGRKVKVFLSNPDSSDAQMVWQRVYKMTPEKIKSFVDTHKADIQVAGSDEIVLTLVANNPGAIGIVNVYSINSTVKVLKVDEKLPLERGYLLHGN